MEGRPPFDQGTPIATLTSVVKDPAPVHPHTGRLGKVISGLLPKTPNVWMRLGRALPIMRAVADEPYGTRLTPLPGIPGPDPRTPTTRRAGQTVGGYAARCS